MDSFHNRVAHLAGVDNVCITSATAEAEDVLSLVAFSNFCFVLYYLFRMFFILQRLYRMMQSSTGSFKNWLSIYFHLRNVDPSRLPTESYYLFVLQS